MKSFTISWPSLGLKVSCAPIAENQQVFDLFCANLPVKVLQGHEVVGGYMLRDRVVHLTKKPYDVTDAVEVPMNQAKEGTVFLFSPQGSSGELVIKYDECVDDRGYIPFAQVAEADMAALKKAGKAAWKSASRTKDVIISVIEGVE